MDFDYSQYMDKVFVHLQWTDSSHSLDVDTVVVHLQYTDFVRLLDFYKSKVATEILEEIISEKGFLNPLIWNIFIVFSLQQQPCK